MYTCNECQSTDFEKFGGFLFCSVCQVQHPDFIEQSVEYDSMALSRSQSQKTKEKRRGLTRNWTLWDSYNCILHGFVKELTATGLAPDKLSSNAIAMWSCLLESSGLDFNSMDVNLFTERGTSKRPKKKHGVKGKKTKPSESKPEEPKKISQRSFSQSAIFSIDSQLSQASDILANETIETIGRSFDEEGNPLEQSSMSQSSKQSSSPRTSKKKTIVPMSKSRLLEIIHIALLMEGSDLHLGDLLRFIREAHMSFAKVTHFLPDDVKVAKGESAYLETVKASSMPHHARQRKCGAAIAKKLCIEEFPFPDMGSLITRYGNDLNLPDDLIDRALVISHVASVEELCSFRKARKQIPNYEGMAAACLIYAMKVLFGLDDRTEFLLSDIAEKTNKLLDPDDALLFSFKDWQNFIELRKTVISEAHYPTEEKYNRNDSRSTTGFFHMVMKENKDTHRQERFEQYKQYYVDPGIVRSFRNVLTSLSQPKTEFNMDFPPTLTPFTSYLSSILNNYEERIKNRTPQDSHLPQLESHVLQMLRTSYKDYEVTYGLDFGNYSELLQENGFTIRKISKRELCETKEDPKRAEEESGQGEETETESGEERPPDDSTTEEQTGSPLKRMKRSSPPKIDYINLSSLKEVYLVEDMALTWKLLSPYRDDEWNVTFLTEVFEKTPVNFQWLVRELSFMMEMTAREIYIELFKLEEAVKKAVALPASTFCARFQSVVNLKST